MGVWASLAAVAGAAGGAVSSVFARVGDVIAAALDYAAAQVSAVAHGTTAATDVQGQLDEVTDEKADKTTTITANSPLSGGGDLSANRTLSVADLVGDAGGGGTRGVVPAPAAGDAALSKFLKANAAWAVPQVNVSAGTTSNNLAAITFANSNGVTFGLNASTITASVAAGGGGLTNVNLSAGTTSQNLSNFIFSNSNGVSFGLNGSTVTGTVATNYQSQGAYLTTAMLSAAATISNIRVSAGTLSALRSDITFNNSNGISFGLETNGFITGSVATNYQSQAAYLTTAALSNHSHGNPTLNLTNLSGTTASASNGFTLSLSAAAPGAGGAVNFSAGTASGNLASVVFSNSNGVSFGLNGSTITATVATNYQSQGAYLTTAALSDHSHGNPTLALTNLSGTTASNSAGLTLSLSAAAPGGGAAPNIQYFEVDDVQGFGLMINVTTINSRPIFVPFILKGNLTNNSLILQLSRASAASNAFTVQAGIYTYANSSSYNLLGSLQNVYSNTATASVSGIRYLVATGWGTAATAMTPGAYILGLNFSAAATASMNYSLFGGLSASSPVGFLFAGSNSVDTSNTTLGIINGWGRYTAGSGALPAALGQTNMIANFAGASLPLAPWFVLRP